MSHGYGTHMWQLSVGRTFQKRERGRRLRTRAALLDRLLQHLSEFRCVPMTVNLHRVLHRHFDELLFTVGGYRDRAFALGRYFPAIDIFPGHDCLL